MAAGWSEQERGGREMWEDRNLRVGVILWRGLVSHPEPGGKTPFKLRAEIFCLGKTPK